MNNIAFLFYFILDAINREKSLNLCMYTTDI